VTHLSWTMVVAGGAALALAATPSAQTPGGEVVRPDFAAFVEELRADALARGVSAATVERAFAGLEPSPTVIERDQTQAEIVLSVDRYVTRRLTRTVVRSGRQHATQHRALLQQVTARYGVPGRVVIAVWGLESNYGRFSGVRPTIQALATLAWEGRRGAFFRGELMDALNVVDRGYIAIDQLRGSWAGAMGQTQFMPSSYLKWAEDFDGDGDRDIWRSTPDVFASIANYLEKHGWSRETTWGREVRLPSSGLATLRERAGMRAEGCRAEREMTNALPLDRWQTLGVRTATGTALPRRAIDASLIHTGQRAYLVYGNYESLLEYNCAHSYALAVALLSEQVGGK
jgi:membrane-bound lytic murein transglycosylase B